MMSYAISPHSSRCTSVKISIFLFHLFRFSEYLFCYTVKFEATRVFFQSHCSTHHLLPGFAIFLLPRNLFYIALLLMYYYQAFCVFSVALYIFLHPVPCYCDEFALYLFSCPHVSERISRNWLEESHLLWHISSCPHFSEFVFLIQTA